MAASRNSAEFLKAAQDEAGEPLALLIGNGVHRYDAHATGNDWNAMTHALAAKHGLDAGVAASALALTELYDLIELALPIGGRSESLQSEFCLGMKDWRSASHHRWMMAWAITNAAPVLTTNFDHVLADAAGASLRSLYRPRGSSRRPTDYYPWEKYFGLNSLDGPTTGFGIWHINGMLEHIRSIRLGLTHYMYSVARARDWLRPLLAGRSPGEVDINNWRGTESWLHIVLSMPVLIVGLQLGAQEVFLRWLLIERARYFRLHPHRWKPAWYVHPASEMRPDDLAKYFFLSSLKVQPVAAPDYDSIYGAAAWGS